MTLIRIGATKKTNINEVWRDCGENGLLTHCAHQPIDNENAKHTYTHSGMLLCSIEKKVLSFTTTWTKKEDDCTKFNGKKPI